MLSTAPKPNRSRSSSPAKAALAVSALSLVLAAGLLGAGSSAALELHVDATTDAPDATTGDGVCATLDGACTLRAAVQEANASPGSDTVVLGPGHHLLSIPGTDEDGAATGDLDVGEPMTLVGAGIGVTIIDGDGLDRVLDVVPTPTYDNSIALEDLSVRGGRTEASGAGVRVSGSNALSRFERVEIHENEEIGGVSDYESGSAIFADAPYLLRDAWVHHNLGLTALQLHEGGTIERSLVEHNDGGAIHHYAFFRPLRLVDSIVRDNGGQAAAVGGDGSAEVRNSLLERNGSGLALGSDTHTWIQDSTIRDHLGTGVVASCGALCQVEIEHSTLSGNLGGGLLVGCDAWVRLRNSTLSGNAAARGAGLLLDDSFGCGTLSVTASNVTITDNAAEDGGGVAIESGPFGFAPAFHLESSILAGNHASSDADCVATNVAGVTSGGHNVVGSGGGCAWLAAPGDLVGSDASPIDPLLATLADNGGRTTTHTPLPGSPAIDAIPSESCLPSDQRGVARPQGPGCDVGAYEVTACADGVDQDGDGLTDHPADPACKDATSTREQTRCQDGLDNDGDGAIDFDGGASVNGGVPIAAADPLCADKPWRATEAEARCGLGGEVVLLIWPLIRRARRRARSAEAGGS